MRGLTPESAIAETRGIAAPAPAVTGQLLGLKGVFLRLLDHRSAVVGMVIVATYVILALFAPWLAPYDPTVQDAAASLLDPSRAHFFGTDQFGRDVFSRSLYGARVSLTVAVLCVALSTTIGSLLGVVAGYYEGLADTVIMRLMDVKLAFPGILLALVLAAIFGNGISAVVLAVGISGIPNFARTVRGSTLSVKQNDYVQAARGAGASDARIMFQHILPNVGAPIIVLSTLYVGTAVLVAATLSFLGVGVQPPTPEWGTMVNAGREVLRRAWWVSTMPGVMIMFLVIGVNLLGDGLRDVLDPKLRTARGQRGG